jgi:hypothetical protein
MFNKLLISLFSILYLTSACNSNPKFTMVDKEYLDGKWKLIKIGVINHNKTFFTVDSSNYNFKKLNINIDKMNFHLTSYPFENFEPSYPIEITNDSIFFLSGTTVNDEIIMLRKKTILYKISEDYKLLELRDFNEKEIMIFSRN